MRARGWHVGRWGPLGWTETAIKLAAITLAIVALATRDGGADRGGLATGCAIVLGVAALGLVAAVADRVIEREAVAMGFVVVNLAGHLAAVALALGLPAARGAVVAYCALMAVGDLVKIVFLRRERFRVRGVETPTLVGLTAIYVVLYAVAGALALAT